MPRQSSDSVHRFLVFTDLDATLLDHSDYSWQAASPAIDALKKHDAPLILCSSKTLAEMVDLALELDTQAPIVAENGAFIAIPALHPLASFLESDSTYDNYQIKLEGLPRKTILGISNTLRAEFDYQFEGFADWTPEELAQKTDLPLLSAERAAQRLATEPILWQDTQERWDAFEQAISEHGIQAIRGGRFIHLMGQTDKANGLLKLTEYYQALYPTLSWTTVALGDSPNDIGMLTKADIGVVIPNPHRSEPLQIHAEHIIRAPHPGPVGWNVVVSNLVHSNSINDLRISKDG